MLVWAAVLERRGPVTEWGVGGGRSSWSASRTLWIFTSCEGESLIVVFASIRLSVAPF